MMTWEMMNQIYYCFYWSIYKWLKLGKKILFFCSFWVFLFTLSYSLWVTPQHFPKWKTLLRYISVVSFISIACVVVKLKILKAFRIDSSSMKWPLFRVFWVVTSPKYCSILLIFWPEVVFNKTNAVFGKPFKILNFGSNRTHLSLKLCLFWDSIYRRKTKNISKVQNFCKNCIPRNIKYR